MIAVFVLAVLLPCTADAYAGNTTGLSQRPEPVAVVAQEEGAQAEEDHAEADEIAPKPWWHWPSKWINFIMLSGLLYWMLVIPPAAVQEIFSYPGLKVIFVERVAAIIAARDLAAEQKQQAAQMLVDSDQRLAKIEGEVAALVADAQRDADHEAQRAVEDGKTQAQKIHEVAQREITNERVTAQRQLRRFVADLAVNLAEKNLAEHLTADDQDRLIREYLSCLGQSMA
jgi:F-type H+-transporting ATPase subunit b